MKKLLFPSLGLLFAAFVFTQCQQPHSTAETSPDPGAKLYLQNCSRCHGDVGMGGPAPGTGINAIDIRQFTKSPAQLVEIINNGWGQMPAFKDSITPENVALIASYVATNIEKHPAANGATSAGK